MTQRQRLSAATDGWRAGAAAAAAVAAPGHRGGCDLGEVEKAAVVVVAATGVTGEAEDGPRGGTTRRDGRGSICSAGGMGRSAAGSRRPGGPGAGRQRRARQRKALSFTVQHGEEGCKRAKRKGSVF